ncbi:MAG: hypothetical protein ACD_5C00274G0001 [uncultured bacterium]|nr:MAG: hypothetical protein ACD_5C00274G0001 [uncultured bacterium]
MPNAAIDYEKQEALNMARMQPPKARGLNVPRNGRAENFRVPPRGRADNYDNTNQEQENNDQANHSDRLNRARQGNPGNKNEAEKAKDLVQDAVNMATPTGIVSLLKHIDFLGDIPYVAAMGAAILKDGSDLVLIGSLPGIGTVISICASIFIFMMMLLVGAGEKRKMAMGILKKGMIIFAGTLLEFIPGLNFVPIETLTIFVVYCMTLSERKHSQNDLKVSKNESDEDDQEDA